MQRSLESSRIRARASLNATYIQKQHKCGLMQQPLFEFETGHFNSEREQQKPLLDVTSVALGDLQHQHHLQRDAASIVVGGGRRLSGNR
jgi:hypothetical protein